MGTAIFLGAQVGRSNFRFYPHVVYTFTLFLPSLCIFTFSIWYIQGQKKNYGITNCCIPVYSHTKPFKMHLSDTLLQVYLISFYFTIIPMAFALQAVFCPIQSVHLIYTSYLYPQYNIYVAERSNFNMFISLLIRTIYCR